MRKLVFTLLMALVTTFTFAQRVEDTGSSSKPKIEFESEIINYGTIKKNADGVRYFKFTNTGSAPLVIEKVKGSCGCTVPTKPEEPIMPGASGEIKVKYATNRVGRFVKTVTIVSNATEKPKVVQIKGEVLPEK